MYKQLKTECKKENANGSEVVRQALRVYFFSFKKDSICYDIIDHAIEKHELYYTAFITRFFIKGDTADTTEEISSDPKDNQVLADAVIGELTGGIIVFCHSRESGNL